MFLDVLASWPNTKVLHEIKLDRCTAAVLTFSGQNCVCAMLVPHGVCGTNINALKKDLKIVFCGTSTDSNDLMYH